LAKADPLSDIAKALEKGLTPKDLSLPREKLVHKIQKLGSGKGLFKLDGDLAGDFTFVKRSKNEWVAILRSEDLDAPPGYWIGAPAGKVLVKLLPFREEALVGGLAGEWRRQGDYLVGVGVNRIMHSPKWQESEVLCYRESNTGISLTYDDQPDVGPEGEPPKFVSASGNDVYADTRGPEYRVLKETRSTFRLQYTKWTFANGRFEEISTPVKDAALALDDLFLAVKRRETPGISAFIPNLNLRKRAVSLIRELIEDGDLDVEDRDYPGVGNRYDFKFAKSKGRWILESVQKADGQD
jgi:hypothetical protein